MTSTLELIVFSGLIGVIIGSFLNVIILRVPKNENISLPASHCMTCQKPLKWYHNIPIFSWILLGGKCAFCKEKISIQYIIIEFLTACMFISIALRIDSVSEAFIYSILFSMLLALSVIDLKYKAVPDCISIPTLFVSFLVGDFFNSFSSALFLIGGFTLLRFVVSWIIKKDAMGEADIIIAGIIGATVGVELGLIAIYISALMALIVFFILSKKEYELPFIPFLAFGLYITWIFSEQATNLIRIIYE
ncbi:MAG: prepilin peptidase [Sulfurospirillum sp.]|nr:prepilin peptidase [Sulfurospirillum sp.]MBL0703357.1 prepilin peptidase [Sulfurospirillum sp.]